MARAPDHALSEIKLARLAGVSATTWRSHKALGCPVPLRARDLPAWQEQYAAWRTANGKVPTNHRRDDANPEATRWAQEKVKWGAIEKRISVGVLAGRLVDRVEVERRTVKQILVVRQALNDMVRKMASRLFNAPSQEDLERELQSEVDHILSSFSRGLEQVVDASTGSAESDSSDRAQEDASVDQGGDKRMEAGEETAGE